MQFTCDSCKALLKIADERVRGKRLVVRCNRCGAKISISDPALPAKKPAAPVAAPQALAATRPPAPPTAAPDDSPIWFVMLQGKQTGPLTRAELSTRVDASEVGPRTYLWKEGMDAWRRGRDVPELAALFPQPAPSATTPQAVPAPQPQLEPALDGPSAPAADIAPNPPAARQEEPPEDEEIKRPGGKLDLAPKEPVPSPSNDLASWANADLATLPNPEAATAKPLAAPPVATPAPPLSTARPASAPGRPRTASPRMFERTARQRSRPPWGIILLAVALAAAAVGAWLYFGAEKKEDKPAPQTQAAAAPVPQPPPPPQVPPTEPPAPQIEPAAVPAAGLTAEQVRKQLDDNKGALQGCIDDALRRDPTLRVGRIHLSTTIAPSGHVTATKIDKRTVDEGPLGACLKRATRRIAFPSFRGQAFDVDIPILVTAGE